MADTQPALPTVTCSATEGAIEVTYTVTAHEYHSHLARSSWLYISGGAHSRILCLRAVGIGGNFESVCYLIVSLLSGNFAIMVSDTSSEIGQGE